MSEGLLILSTTFFFVSIFYSMVGFGGGSSYIALLILLNVYYLHVPAIALICNIIVVTGGIIHFVRNGQFSIKLLLPFIVSSIPFAFVGGSIPIDKIYFQLILGGLLFLAGLKMIFFKKIYYNYSSNADPSMYSKLTLGGLIGFISGLVGIGGGIFLAPILYLLKWETPKKIAATSSAFIFVNSIAGLLGQGYKAQGFGHLVFYWPLFLSVLVGGQIGSILCNSKFSPRRIEVLTSILVLIVSYRLIYNSMKLI